LLGGVELLRGAVRSRLPRNLGVEGRARKGQTAARDESQKPGLSVLVLEERSAGKSAAAFPHEQALSSFPAGCIAPRHRLGPLTRR
jgi:hypothetical protein